MAALVQSFPQQSSTITMLQTRPSSASGLLQSTSQGQGHHQYPAGTTQMHLNGYHVSGSLPNTYRGQVSMAPVAPYGYTSTPGLSINSLRPQQAPYLRTDQRTYSAPVVASLHAPDAGQGGHRSRYPAPASISTSSSSSSELSAGTQQTFSRDDSAIPSTAWVATRAPRPQSTFITSAPAPKFLAPNPPTPTKPSPDRYRRPAQRRTETLPSPSTQQQNSIGPATQSGSVILNSTQVFTHSGQNSNFSPVTGYPVFSQTPSLNTTTINNTGPFSTNLALRAAVDDMHLRRPTREEASRYRRRSIHTVDLGNQSDAQLRVIVPQAEHQQDHQHPLRSSPVIPGRPASSPGRSGTFENPSISHSNQAGSLLATKREQTMPTVPANPAPSAPAGVAEAHLKYDQPQLVNIPPRVSSTDAAKRVTNPSPLSKPMTMSAESPVSKDSFASNVSAALQTPAKATYAQVAQGVRPQSPAAKQLAALNDKENKKSKSSRLRRAFSFGSAAELRKAAENHETVKTTFTEAGDRSRLRKERYQNEREAEQARIAQQQEAGGIGQGIYSGQGNIFSGSTDNLSISSTASSASIMIRKMGQGMKKSTRSLVGLFRPKSVIGVPAAEPAIPQHSQAQVSMVTAEAEREKVNVNADPKEQAGGGTGFPRLERNSVDATANAHMNNHERTSSADSSIAARKSIIGGEKERAEILAAVKKGILKRSATDSPTGSPIVRPIDKRTPSFNLPMIPNVNDSPTSSAPSTPGDDAHGHKRTNSVTLGGEDYFMSALRFRGDSKSVPNTPPGTVKRNATFSPRIIFHDTWPSTDYDRRSELATCNRLTPMLAQQIKEELNSFKMEMEVHENSKIYTHFF